MSGYCRRPEERQGPAITATHGAVATGPGAMEAMQTKWAQNDLRIELGMSHDELERGEATRSFMRELEEIKGLDKVLRAGAPLLHAGVAAADLGLLAAFSPDCVNAETTARATGEAGGAAAGSALGSFIMGRLMGIGAGFAAGSVWPGVGNAAGAIGGAIGGSVLMDELMEDVEFTERVTPDHLMSSNLASVL